MKNKPKLVTSKTLHRNFLTLREDLLLNSETKKQYHCYWIEPISDSVTVLARTRFGEWLVTREYRHPCGQTLLSLPGGYIDQNETPIDAGLRELREESGFSADQLVVVGEAYPYGGISSQKIYYILALNAQQIGMPTLETAEYIESLLLLEEQLAESLEKEALDGNLCTALFFSRQWLDSRRIQPADKYFSDD